MCPTPWVNEVLGCDAVAQELDQWLGRLGLDKYVDVFVKHDIGIDVLSDVTELHLRELGISIGDRLGC
jgi:hypothetical protein